MTFISRRVAKMKRESFLTKFVDLSSSKSTASLMKIRRNLVFLWGIQKITTHPSRKINPISSLPRCLTCNCLRLFGAHTLITSNNTALCWINCNRPSLSNTKGLNNSSSSKCSHSLADLPKMQGMPLLCNWVIPLPKTVKAQEIFVGKLPRQFAILPLQQQRMC